VGVVRIDPWTQLYRDIAGVSMTKSIPTMPKVWQQFLISVLFIVFFPLAVLAIDLATKGRIPDQDLYLTFSLYIIGAGTGSREEFTLAISMILSLGYLLVYGFSASMGLDCRPVLTAVTPWGYFWRYGPTLVFSCFVVSERYNRHVVNSERFWDFS